MQHGHALAQLGGGVRARRSVCNMATCWHKRGGGAGLAEVDATCAWAHADTTWWVGLTEVDATWTRAGTKGGGQGSQKWMQHVHGHVLTQLGGQGSQKWVQHAHGHVLTQLTTW